MNTYAGTHCALCRSLDARAAELANIIHSTKLRDAELVEPLLRKLPPL